MCGIAGVIGAVNDENLRAVRRMTDAMRLRGPDAEGYWNSQPDGVGSGLMLGHRRLAILDLSPLGIQPMTHPESGDTLALNGEIYNYQSFRAELAAEPSELKSTGDTAVLLRLLAKSGESALPRLRGMFALCYWDASTESILIARDPLGIKPLYFALNGGSSADWSFAFASEVRALLASGLLKQPRLSPAAVQSVLWNGFTVAPETAVTGIESLLPGEGMWLDRRGRVIRRFVFWEYPRPSEERPATPEELENALLESVRLHLISDVPVGVFLSGGVDSSAVANLAARASSGDVNTFTLAFEEKERNEGGYARSVAAAIGTRHHEIVLTEKQFLQRLATALDSLDQPTFDGLNSYFMSRAVRDAGFTVALVGSGGDELFGGYTSFRDLPALIAALGAAGSLPRALVERVATAAGTVLRLFDRGYAAQTRWAKLPGMIRRGGSTLGLYQLAYALFLPETQRLLSSVEFGSNAFRDGLPIARHQVLGGEIDSRTVLSAIGLLEQRLFLGERLLRDTDAVSMAASLETRLPLVDTSLLEVVVRMPDHSRFQPVREKRLLRTIGLKGLDPRLFDRPKAGFELPFDRWLRNALGDEIDATLADAGQVRAAGLDPPEVLRLWRAFRSGARGLYWTRVWALYSLVRWSRVNGVTA